METGCVINIARVERVVDNINAMCAVILETITDYMT
jgi:hypothetical protein